MGVGHERGILVLDAEELIDRIIVPLPLFAFDLVLDKPIEHVGGKFFVEKIQAPGTKPNQVDQKNRERDDREENDRKEPLQNALKHESTCSPLIPDWSIKTCSRLALSRRNRDLQTRRQSAVATA